MDGFNGREFYGHSLSNDPKLRTTTRNYEFKFNSPDHLEKIISDVQKDRAKHKEIEEFEFSKNRIRFRNHFSKMEQSEIMELPKPVETEMERLNSREQTVVKIMSDEDIEEMISQALNPKTDLTDVPETNLVPSEEIVNLVEPQKIDTLPKTSVEMYPHLQPQWVEIKPVQKSVANLFETVKPCSNSNDDSSDYEDLSDLNLADETLMNETEKSNRLEKKTSYFDSLSFDSRMSDEFVIRNHESVNVNQTEDDNDDNQHESPLQSPISLGAETNLNLCEHMEMERVFGKDLHVPIMEFDGNEIESSDESENSDQQNDENVESNVRVDDDDIEVRDFKEQFEEQLNPRLRSENTLSFLSAQSSEPKIPKSKKTTPKSVKRNSPKVTADIKTGIQIEDLKQEKLRIFTKMTTIQEKIIKSLDALRINLVELSLPDGEAEKKTRERNALEFSVRFSRNYLFPLGKMIEDLRLSPKDDYRSALTNEPCVKVCGIYGLLCQAVQCYQKQLQHFFTDSFPKKLDQLLILIKDTTNICLEKQIFDKRDILIQALTTRCEMFLEFVMEFAEKKKSARSREIAMQSSRRSRFKLPKTSSKWDLTMSLNNLNMYEPKLVQKKPKKSLPKKPMESNRQKVSPKPTKKNKYTPRESADDFAFVMEDPVDTQVKKDNDIDCLQLIDDAIAEQPDSELAKAVIETLQDITKDEVHQMFGPIVSNLDSILKSSVSFVNDFEK